MRVAVYRANDNVRVEEKPEPTLSDGDLLLRVDACGICGSDVLEWYRKPRAPVVLGHEIVGTVQKATPGSPFPEGTRLVVSHHVPCMECRACRRGTHAACALLRATHLDPGGLAERTRVPRVNLRDGALSIPDALSDEEAVFVEPLGCVLRGQRHARLGAGDSVLVLGCGAAGLLHVMAAKLRGARVVAVDTQKSRADWARRVGADRALVAGEEIGPALREVAAGAADGADVVVAATGAPAAVRTALDVVAPGGTILWFAPAGPDFVLEANFNRLWRDEIRMTASYAASPADLRQSLALLSSGRVSVRPLVTHRFPLAGVGEAFRLVAEAREGLKIVVRPNA